MKYNPQIHHRRSIRLPGFDYGQSGVYFITLCTRNKECWFGEIHNAQMRLNQLGKIVAQEWLKTPKIRPEITLDSWIIRPNHLHGIIIIQQTDTNEPVGAHRRAPFYQPAPNIQPGFSFHPAPNTQPAPSSPEFRRSSKSLPSIIAGFKSATTKRINQQRETPRLPLWQRNYYESIVRDPVHLKHIRHYIRANPTHWQDDPEFSQYALINDYDLPF